MKLGQGRVSIPGRKAKYSASPATPSYVPTSTPGMYGGPPGSFITRSYCPPGYNPVPLTKTIGSGITTEKRCVPKPIPIITVPPPAPQITVSPTFTQESAPQFSPTVQQQQDSPDATQAASPQQVITTPSPLPSVITAPIPAPLTESFILPANLPIPSALPGTITAPPQLPETKEPFTFMKGNNLMPIMIGSIALLFMMRKEQ